MAIAHVQSATGDWSSGSSYTTAITATNGNLLVVSIHFHGSGSATDISSISDGTNTYTLVDTFSETVAGDLLRLSTYYAKNITGGALTITTTLTNSLNILAVKTVVCEVSGADTTAPLDVHTIQKQVSPGSGTDAITSGAVTTTADGEYVYGAVQPLNNSTFTQGTGYTSVVLAALAGAERQIQTSAGSIAGTFTETNGTSTYFTAVATFKAAGGGGRTTKNTRAFPLGTEIGMGWVMPTQV